MDLSSYRLACSIPDDVSLVHRHPDGIICMGWYMLDQPTVAEIMRLIVEHEGGCHAQD